jgi:sugar phosphate isomerase/epimerase
MMYYARGNALMRGNEVIAYMDEDTADFIALRLNATSALDDNMLEQAMDLEKAFRDVERERDTCRKLARDLVVGFEKAAYHTKDDAKAKALAQRVFSKLQAHLQDIGWIPKDEASRREL